MKKPMIIPKPLIAQGADAIANSEGINIHTVDDKELNRYYLSARCCLQRCLPIYMKQFFTEQMEENHAGTSDEG